jgi:predicted nucleic acid-binding protein
MRPFRFLDTNILLYSISGDPGEAEKKQTSILLIDRDDNAVSAQVLSEFYVQATRPSRRDAIPHEIAAGLVQAWGRFPVQPITLAIVTEAMHVRALYGFSYWDSAIIAAAVALGCRELCSEDMSHGREVDGVRIVNPFR